MSQVYMTAKLNLADGTILYPQVSLDNIVASISDPTLVSVATTTNGKVTVTELPVVTVVGDTGSNDNIPTEAAVRALADTKQNTLVAGTGTEIINGSTINAMAVNLNDVVVNNVPNNGLYLEVEGNTMSVVAPLAANDSAGVIAGATNGVQLVDGVAQFDVATAPVADGETAGLVKTVGDGLLVEGGTAHIDEASVETTLQDVRIGDGSTVTPVDDQVVTPGNLRGALSVGQAVDVTCVGNKISGYTTYPTNSNFLDTFSLVGSGAWCDYGWNAFPKFASGLKYLYIMDLTNNSQGAFQFTLTRGSWIIGQYASYAPARSVFIQPNETVRLAYIFTESAPFITTLYPDGASGYGCDFTIQNCRQYEVTALTDEAIAYIAQLPDPDAFFRSEDAYSIRDKYLIKQDMVSPFIPIISMSNSDLTIAAGLAYQMQITDSNTHKFTVDTIPTNGYGWDSHLQLFVNDLATVQFVAPLILEDPLTPNSGHNITIKWRAGQALAYVDDTDVGYIVTVTAGTENGSLYYGMTNDTGNYIVFANTTDGHDIVVDLQGNTDSLMVLENYYKSIVGNGTDKTTITTANPSGGALYVWENVWYSITNARLECSICAASFGHVTISGCLFKDTVTYRPPIGEGWNGLYLKIVDTVFDNCTYSYNPSGMDSGVVSVMIAIALDISGCTFTNMPDDHYCLSVRRLGTIDSCLFVNNDTNAVFIASEIATLTFSNCTFTNNSGGAIYFWEQAGDYADNVTVNGCTFSTASDTIRTRGGGTVTFSGINIINSTVSGSGGIKLTADSEVISTTPSGSTIGTGQISIQNSGISMNANATLQNIKVTGCTNNAGNNGLVERGIFKNCEFYNNRYAGINGSIFRQSDYWIVLDGCRVHDNVVASGDVYTFSGILYLKNTATVRVACAGIGSTYNWVPYIYIDGTVGTNIWCINGDRRAVVRIVDGATMSGPCATNKVASIGTNSTPGDYNTPWIVGGTATIVYTGGSTVLSGIGTYINADGTHDFAVPYTVTSASGTGSGTLHDGLTGSAKYLLVDYDLSSATAVLGSAESVAARPLNFVCADGETIFGGTISLAASSTVSVGVAKNTNGAVDVLGSTVGIKTEASARPTITGINRLNGKLFATPAIGENAMLSGWGKPYSVLDFTGASTVCDVYNGAVIQNLTIQNEGWFSNKAALFMNANSVPSFSVSITATKFTGCNCPFGLVWGGTVNISYCDFINNSSGPSTSYGSKAVYDHCYFSNASSISAGIIQGWNGSHAEISGCTFATQYSIAVMYQGSDIKLSGYNKTLSRIIADGTYNASQEASITFVSGSTVDMTGNTTDNSTTNTIVCTTSTGVVVESGTVTVILANGSTHHVSGSGTYINSTIDAGTGKFTDLTQID